MTEKYELVEALMENTYTLIDIYPMTVPKDKRDVYFEVEEYFNQVEERQRFADKLIRILLKTACYFDMEICYEDQWIKEVKRDQLIKIIQDCIVHGRGWANILLTKENTLIQMSSGDLYIPVYNPSERVNQIVGALVQSEGLFWRTRC